MATAKGNKIDRRALLLKISREIFAEKGFEATTISEIVARAGVAQGTFYWYFPSKVSLMVTLAREMQSHIEKALNDAYANSDHLSAMIEQSVHSAFLIMEQYRDVLAIIRTTTMRWIETPADRERIFSPYYSLISELIHQEQAKDVVAPEINPEATAVLIVGTVYYAAEECYVFNSPIPADVFITQCTGFIQRALGLK